MGSTALSLASATVIRFCWPSQPRFSHSDRNLELKTLKNVQNSVVFALISSISFKKLQKGNLFLSFVFFVFIVIITVVDLGCVLVLNQRLKCNWRYWSWNPLDRSQCCAPQSLGSVFLGEFWWSSLWTLLISGVCWWMNGSFIWEWMTHHKGCFALEKSSLGVESREDGGRSHQAWPCWKGRRAGNGLLLIKRFTLHWDLFCLV